MAGHPKPSRRAAGNDNAPADHAATGGLVADLVMAIRFYSLLPSGESAHEAPDLNRIARAVPLASLVIAVGPALVIAAGAGLQFPGLFTALLAIGLSALLTGAMAEDALGDSADGLGGRTPERRLEILRDSRIGAYGVIAISLFIGLRAAALAHLIAIGGIAAAPVYLAGVVLSRTGSLWLAHALPAARSDGASASAGRLSRSSFLIGAGFACLLAFILAAPFVSLLGLFVGIVVVAVVALMWVRVCRELFGGQSGDLIGGLQAVLEIAVLTAFIAMAGQSL